MQKEMCIQGKRFPHDRKMVSASKNRQKKVENGLH